MPSHRRLSCSILAMIGLLAPPPLRAGDFELTVIDADTKQPIACRMHLFNANGRPRKIKKYPYWHDHFVFPGTVKFDLPKGTYKFELERGPEYVMHTGHFVIEPFSDDRKTVELQRHVNMAEEGWYAGDLHIHRPVKDIELLMRAEELYVAPVITWWNEKSEWEKEPLPENPLVEFEDGRYAHLLAGEDEREGGALLYFNLPRPLDLTGSTREYPSPLSFVEQARRHEGVHIDAEKPFWWDVPTWLAGGEIDSIGLANNHMCRGEMYRDEAWGKPRDEKRLPSPWGNGEWSQEIYYHVLNAGLRIPPSAGSASGVLPNPVGYNRVYVYCGDDFSYESWWEGLRAGRVMVTNGPLLRPIVNGRYYPGEVFQGEAGDSLEFNIALNLATRDKIRYLEIVKNGEVAATVRLEELAENNGRLPPVTFEESGWFLVRAVTDVEHTYRFASTGPYYVEIGERPRISRASSQFFLDWVNERIARIQLDDEAQQREVLAPHERAREFWQQRLDEATAE